MDRFPDKWKRIEGAILLLRDDEWQPSADGWPPAEPLRNDSKPIRIPIPKPNYRGRTSHHQVTWRRQQMRFRRRLVMFQQGISIMGGGR